MPTAHLLCNVCKDEIPAYAWREGIEKRACPEVGIVFEYQPAHCPGKGRDRDKIDE